MPRARPGSRCRGSRPRRRPAAAARGRSRSRRVPRGRRRARASPRTRRSRGATPGRSSTCSRPSRAGRSSPGSRSAGARRPRADVRTASVVITTSIVARPGASIPAPLAMPPIVQPSAAHGRGLRHGVGRHDGVRGVVSAIGGEARDAGGGAVEDLRAEDLVARADEAGRADEDVARAHARAARPPSRRSGASSGSRTSR